jgi:hypothetical protein
MKSFSASGSTVLKAIIIQVVIAAMVIAWFKFVLPMLGGGQAAAAAARRETRIETLFQSLAVEDVSPSAPAHAADGASAESPRHLLRTPMIDEIKQELGAPSAVTGDYRGGAHLIWAGTNHKLEASFNHERLYCLRMEDVRTGHGELVFESSSAWRAF